MNFFNKDAAFREKVVSRVMREAKERFNHDVTAQKYMDIYEAMLQRPLIVGKYD